MFSFGVVGSHCPHYQVYASCPPFLLLVVHLEVEFTIKQFYDDSYGIYGSPRIHRDLREAGVHCGVKRVARLM